MKVYLAGPEVFLPDAADIGERKRAICAAHGLTGVFPLDGEEPALETVLGSRRIFEANLRLLHACDGVIANMTPFRGVGADPGTVFELGAAFALNKRVFAYSNVNADVVERVRAAERMLPRRGADGRLYAGDGLAIEDFGLSENLMLVEALRTQGEDLLIPAIPPGDPWRDLTLFESCVRRAAAVLLRRA